MRSIIRGCRGCSDFRGLGQLPFPTFTTPPSLPGTSTTTTTRTTTTLSPWATSSFSFTQMAQFASQVGDQPVLDAGTALQRMQGERQSTSVFERQPPGTEADPTPEFTATVDETTDITVEKEPLPSRNGDVIEPTQVPVFPTQAQTFLRRYGLWIGIGAVGLLALTFLRR